MSDKVMPSSREAEEAILGAILIDGSKAFEKANGWIRDNNAFYYDKNKVLYSVISDMHRDGKDIDMITVSDKIKDLKKENPQSGLDMYYITGLPEKIPTTSNIESYSKIVWEKFIKRETIKSAHNLYNTGFDTKDQAVEDLLHGHQKLLTELLEIAPSKKKEIGSVINETISTLKTGKNIIKFGYPALDNISILYTAY